jgi:excisionase family DNA binding protein
MLLNAIKRTPSGNQIPYVSPQGAMMPPCKKAKKATEPQQITFIEPQPQVKNGDILDVDEAAILLKVSRKTIYNRVKAGTLPHARVGRKLLFSRQKLHQWVALGGDLAGTMVGNESSSLEQMLNSGQARVVPKH